MVNCNPETVSHRLRHLRPALLRAADARGRAGDRRTARSPTASSCSSAARRRSSSRCRSSRPACRSSARRPTRSTAPRTASASARCSTKLEPAPARQRHRALARRGDRDRRAASATRCWCARPTCSAAAPWRSSTSEHDLRALHAARGRGVARPPGADRPFLEDAIEVDVDAVSDGRDVVIGGIMEHIERAGVHSGDSACALPPYSIDAEVQDEIRRQTIALARELGVVGLMNVQFAVQGRRRSTSSRSTRAPRARCRSSARRSACRSPRSRRACMAGKTLAELGLHARRSSRRTSSVKEAVFPFLKFPGVDTVLGPEMKSTGEVMGIDATFGVRLRQGAARRRHRPADERARSSSASPERRRGGLVPIAAAARAAGLRAASRRAARRTRCAARGLAVDDDQQGAARAARTSSTRSRRGEVALVINTPRAPRRSATRSRSGARRSSAACRTSRPSPAPARRGRGHRAAARGRAARCGRCRSTTAGRTAR